MTVLSFPDRIVRTALLAGAVFLAFVLVAAQAEAKRPPRVGGKVDIAWPKDDKGKPGKGMERYLARQVGALRPPVAIPDTHVTTRADTVSDAGSISGEATIEGGGGDVTTPLRLVRSFDIPKTDPAFDRLLNVSFTYDSALAATAFVATETKGDRAQAEQLLDQLAALQRTDGSIDYAFDTLTGASDPHAWAGTIAWTGYAAELYRSTYKSDQYDAISEGVNRWLTSQQLPNGLIQGGPKVSWASTLHNLMAWNFFTAYARNTGEKTSAQATEMAARIAEGIDKNLLVSDETGMHFKQGFDDETAALDAQTLGIDYLVAQGREKEAASVADWMEANFAVAKRSIDLSSEPETFNETYSSPGPFRGYRPYAADDGPDVLWMEGTLEARLALVLLGRETGELDASIVSWREVAGDSIGPLMADRTVSTSAYNEYHVWPVSSTASWTLLSGASTLK